MRQVNQCKTASASQLPDRPSRSASRSPDSGLPFETMLMAKKSKVAIVIATSLVRQSGLMTNARRTVARGSGTGS